MKRPQNPVLSEPKPPPELRGLFRAPTAQCGKFQLSGKGVRSNASHDNLEKHSDSADRFYKPVLSLQPHQSAQNRCFDRRGNVSSFGIPLYLSLDTWDGFTAGGKHSLTVSCTENRIRNAVTRIVA